MLRTHNKSGQTKQIQCHGLMTISCFLSLSGLSPDNKSSYLTSIKYMWKKITIGSIEIQKFNLDFHCRGLIYQSIMCTKLVFIKVAHTKLHSVINLICSIAICLCMFRLIYCTYCTEPLPKFHSALKVVVPLMCRVTCCRQK